MFKHNIVCMLALQTADVTDTEGVTRHYATRERPFLLLSNDGARRPVALFTAVTLPGQSFTSDLSRAPYVLYDGKYIDLVFRALNTTLRAKPCGLSSASMASSVSFARCWT